MRFFRLPAIAASLTAAILMTICTANLALADGQIQWRRDLRQAIRDSARQGKPVLIQFTAPNCRYCHKMLRETYADRQVIQRVKDCFIPVILSAEENQRLVEQNGITIFPTTMILSAKTRVAPRMTGFQPAAAFARQLRRFCPSRVDRQ